MHRLSELCLSLAMMLSLPGCITADVTESGIYRPIAGGALDVTALAEAAPAFTMTLHEIVARDGARLNGVLLTQPQAKVTVVFFGGNGFILERAVRTAARFESFGVNLIMVDTRGYGTSAAGNEAPTVSVLMNDGEDIFDYAEKLISTTGQKIIVHGHSMGSFVAGHVAAIKPADGVVLQSSATTADDFAYGLIPGVMKPFVKLNIEQSLQGEGNLKNMPQIDEPLLIIVGSKDKQTVPSMSTTLYEASPLPEGRKRLVIVEGAGHNDIFEHDDGKAAYLEFLAKLR